MELPLTDLVNDSVSMRYVRSALLFTIKPGPFWSAEAVAVALPSGAWVLAMAMVFFCWLRSPPAMLMPMLPLPPLPEALITAELVLP
ncbi:hypothetical protein D3C72_1606170 [compost metagenome]